MLCTDNYQVLSSEIGKEQTKTSSPLQALSHELSLGKAKPPLHRDIVSICSPEHNQEVVKQPTFDGPAPPANNLACNRIAVSWRT